MLLAATQPNGFDRAKTLFEQRHWVDAARAFQQVEDTSPGKTDALLYVGKSLINAGKFSDAGKALQRYSSAHPHSDDALYLLAYVRFRENKPEESLKLSTEAAQIKAPKADDLKIVALDYVLLNDSISATRYLEQALATEPDNVDARYALGRVLYQQNKFDGAIAAFEEVLRLQPAHVKALDNLGLAFEGKNQMGQALSAYRKATEIDGASPVHNDQPYLNLGRLLAKMNKSEDGLPILVRAAEIAPQSGRVHLELGKTYLSLNRLQQAKPELEEAVRLQPDESTGHYLLARLYQRMGSKQLAEKEFKVTQSLIDSKRAGPDAATGMSPR